MPKNGGILQLVFFFFVKYRYAIAGNQMKTGAFGADGAPGTFHVKRWQTGPETGNI